MGNRRRRPTAHWRRYSPQDFRSHGHGQGARFYFHWRGGVTGHKRSRRCDRRRRAVVRCLDSRTVARPGTSQKLRTERCRARCAFRFVADRATLRRCSPPSRDRKQPHKAAEHASAAGLIMRILVLDGNQNQAVASVRSLARAGHEVLVGETGRWSKAGWSRSCRATFPYPDPRQDAGGFVARIAELAAPQSGTLVLPMTEATTLPLSARRDVLETVRARFVLPSHADVLRAFNKDEMTRL